jgi:Uma2 family endonuclease
MARAGQEATLAMSIQTERPAVREIVYPDCDGEPMSDNTLQWEWMVTVKGGVDALFRDDPDVFVAGDLLWYPVEGDPTIRMAPDVMVVFGRPKGYRGSYMQWREGGIAPQVVMEILSPGNRAGKMIRKFQFYDRYGVEEYYIYDPETNELTGWLRSGAGLQEIPEMAGWVSPRLGIRFEPGVEDLKIYGPDGRPLASYVELAQQRDELAQQRDELAQQRDELAQQRDELAQQRDALAQQRETERQRAERLAAQLRALGLEPES